jgi:hypothetical protein
MIAFTCSRPKYFIPSTKEIKMKNIKLTLSTVFAGALLVSVAGTRADEGHDQAKGEAHSMDSMKKGAVMSSHDGMTALYAHLQEIETQLAAGKLDGMHEHAEAIKAATRELDKDTTLEAAKKKRVQGYVKNAAKLADKLHEAADAKKPDETQKEFAKLKAQIDLLDKQFAHSHKPATAGKKAEAGKAQDSGK